MPSEGGDIALLIARLDRFNGWPWPWSALLTVSVVLFFALYDVLTLGIAAPVMGLQLNVSPATLASFGTVVALMGYLMGSIVYSHVADSMGRRVALNVTLMTSSIGSVLTGLSTDLLEVYAFRFMTGIGIGAALAVAAAYLSEMAPASKRGRYQSLGTFFGFVGAGVGPLLGYLIMMSLPTVGWRIYFIIGGIGALAVLGVQRILPESPRWLIAKGRIGDAEEVIDRMDEWYSKHRGAPPPVPEVKGTAVEGGVAPLPMSSLFTRKFLPRLLLVLVVFLVYYFWTYPFLAMTPSLLAAAGFGIATSLLVVGLGSLGYAVGSFLSYVFSDLVERKHLISIAFLLSGLSMIGIAMRPGVVGIIAFDFLGALFNTWLATMLYVYAAENFPTRARSNGLAFTDGVGHLAPIFSLPYIGAMFTYYATVMRNPGIALYYSYLLLGLVMIAGAFVVLPGIRSTHRRLEEISG